MNTALVLVYLKLRVTLLWVVSLAVLALACAAPPALAVPAQPRLALVIANSDYASLPGLPNAARDGLTDDLLAAGARTVVVVLDMCRSPLDPPLPAATPAQPAATLISTAGGAPGSKGLVRYAAAQRRPDQGYLVAYSTSPDQVAF